MKTKKMKTKRGFMMLTPVILGAQLLVHFRSHSHHLLKRNDSSANGEIVPLSTLLTTTPVKKNATANKMFTASIRINMDGHVVKTVGGTKIGKRLIRQYNIVQRELCVLRQLQRFPWCPRLVNDTIDSITTSFVGVPVNATNIPQDYAAQFNQILNDMSSVGIAHNDIIYPRPPDDYSKIEVMVLDGRLSLLDFGWATMNGKVPCRVNRNLFFKEYIDPVRKIPWTPYNDSRVLQALHDIAQSLQDRGRSWEAHIILDWKSVLTTAGLQDLLPPTIHIYDVLKRDAIADPNVRFDTLRRFYGVPVRDDRFKNPYVIYLVNDTAPVYDFRKTTQGQRRVNTGIFDVKKHCRNKRLAIHATDNIQETRENMAVLDLDYPPKRGFESLQDVFQALNDEPSFSYVVLRNFDGLPDQVSVGEHFDLNLLVSDYYTAKRILDATSTTDDRYEDGSGRVQNVFRILGTKLVQTDIRYLGDNYMDAKWQNETLVSRVKVRGLYIPNSTHYKYSLLYHAIVQKRSISATYQEQFKSLFGHQDTDTLIKGLVTWMNQHGYTATHPTDASVGRFVERLNTK